MSMTYRPIRSSTPTNADKPDGCAAAPPTSAEPARSGAESSGRIVAVDLVRALALFGMFAVNLGLHEEWAAAGVPDWLADLPHGRSSATFAVLAGWSLALLSGGRAARTERGRRQAAVKIAIRGVLLIVLGTALVAAGATIPVIIASYGVFFLLSLPFLRLGVRGLAVAAGVVAVVGPVIVRYVHLLASPAQLERLLPYDPVIGLGQLFTAGFGDIIHGGEPPYPGYEFPLAGYELGALLIYGFYPTGAFLTYVLAGMALGRLDLARRATQLRLAVLGPVLMIVGYGVPLLLHWLRYPVIPPFDIPEPEPAPQSLAEFKTALAGLEPWSLVEESSAYQIDRERSGLLDAYAHSGTTFEILGNLGVAIALLVIATALLTRWEWLRSLLAPVAAAGTMTLTAYTAQALGFAVLEDGSPIRWLPQTPQAVFGWFVVGSIVFAFAWSQLFRRGPLEQLFYLATKPARLIR
ncbi:DUF418 domain-containing protein [Natronosporangium hydrolyticum]|uniref:DUF418 domain-containing protein n=1 Tax=Natronosporangium hydrolyticum TaxID=2811111 RepID=A0A895YCS5_9ACTN|nr:DUF418 domain-containing protein [Natronosporangium hydrolyticum]QSB15624.1 DUF418 domain-containing protein [Natronosporangium hydrolyticum]